MPRRKNKGRKVGRPVQLEIPRDQIIEAAKSIDLVRAKIVRTNQHGQFATLMGSPFAIATTELLEIDTWLSKNIGGGRFKIECFMPNSLSEVIETIPVFQLIIEGLPVASNVEPINARHATQLRQERPYIPGVGPEAVQQNRPSDFMRSTPDEIAMSQLGRREEDVIAERAAREADRKEAEKAQKKLEGELLAMQKKLLDEENKRERAIMEAKIEAMGKAHAAPPPKAPIDWAALAPTIVAVGGIVTPILVATIGARGERDRTAREREQAAILAQQNSQTELIKVVAGNKQEDPWLKLGGMVTTAIPLVAPLVKHFMDARSPDKVAELVSTMADNNLSQLSMMKQFLDPILQQEDNPLVGFLQSGIQAMIDTAKHMVSATEVPKPQPRQAPQPNGNGAGNGHTQRVLPADDDSLAKTAQYHVDLIVNAANIPRELKSPEWQSILFDIHTFEPEDDVAKTIAQLLAAQQAGGTLPPYLEPIFSEQSGVQPSQVLGQFLSGLPAASINAAYVQNILNEFDALFAPEA